MAFPEATIRIGLSNGNKHFSREDAHGEDVSQRHLE
jgi:hypothetical protein